MTFPGRSRSTGTPLRVKLVAAVVALAALGLLISSAVATTALHNYLLNRVDAQLLSAVQDQGQLNALLDEGNSRRGPRGAASLGTVYLRFGDITNRLPPGVSEPHLPVVARADRRPFTVRSADSMTRWRVIEGPAVDRVTGVEGVLVIGIPLEEIQRTVTRLRTIQLVVGLVVLLLLGAAAFLLVRRNLRPLVAVERTAEAIAAGNLSLRVPDSDPRTEVGSLSNSFNEMLGQIETAFTARALSEAEARASEDRMRRFVADASHELRTPLTSIRGFAELYRQGALPAREDVDRAMGRVESEAARMGLLVEDLLLLARLDQQRPLERARVDLLELAGDAVQDARAVDPARSVLLSVGSADVAPVVVGDAPRLRQVFGNLVSNALTHTPDGTPVVVTLSTHEGQAVVEVADTGPGIPAEDRVKVFERFYRADSSRTRAKGGNGLGLSIVAALVSAHGGSVEAVETPGGGATFRVCLPLVAG